MQVLDRIYELNNGNRYKIKVEVLKKLKKFLEDNLDYHLDMGNYLTNSEGAVYFNVKEYKKHFCNTDCCLAGLIPHVAPEYADYEFCTNGRDGHPVINFKLILRDVMGSAEISGLSIGAYLFGTHNGNGVQQAIFRLESVINKERELYEKDKKNER